MDRLKGKRALITGGTTGIGLATARQFLLEGARVMVTGWNENTLDRARQELGREVPVVRIDAGKAGDQQLLRLRVEDTFGRLDVAVLNAGIGVFKPLEEWDEQSFNRSVDVNLKGPFFLMQALLPVLANPASIVLTGSVNAHIGMATSSVYSATKAALRSLARTLSGELVSRGVRVNTLSPGPVATPIYRKLGLPDDALQEMSQSLLKQLPAGRFADPVEIAHAAVFLASDESAYAIGSEIVMDGGFTTL
ncbi:SDR family oxidoreductase [Ramlibacter tataouinensis]|uniref:Dehydrogenases with different specificities (Related to short-chain alcohol dehydrogenases)-like protein n=1 Tax=Ramlibacter tataouinensis (strain ATCC BAA-407 / DSM 14655 / LMG 21543 / TTB310) TaxID=365046 RepID=F5Y626_RAMTT|nr:SDR family oxidoreductase [Ramlibacter tataouinensis]AEG91530.1 dehydrogenases with different specificities (related to short-chain alcohol dehydrogenases)-like protein [Ramlibacter tataouinensis TTB310]